MWANSSLSVYYFHWRFRMSTESCRSIYYISRCKDSANRTKNQIYLNFSEMQPIFETSLKDTTNLSRIQIFMDFSYYGLITHSFVWGSTLFVYSAITFFFDTIRISSYLMLPESFGGLASLVFFTNSSYSQQIHKQLLVLLCLRSCCLYCMMPALILLRAGRWWWFSCSRLFRFICYRWISLRVSCRWIPLVTHGRWWCHRGQKGWFQEFRWCRIGQRQSSGNW